MKHNPHTPDELWTLIVRHQGATFTTSRGVPFTYVIPNKKTTDAPGGEMFIRGSAAGTVWRTKSITRAGVMRAYQIACDIEASGSMVTGPKALRVFGKTHIYGIFRGLGILSTSPNGQPSLFENEADTVEKAGEKRDEGTQRLDRLVNIKIKENREMSEEKAKRVRRSAEEVKAEKITQIEAKIARKQAEIEELRSKVEELRRPKKLPEKERQTMLKEKVDAGVLTEDEAYMLGWKGWRG